MIVGSWTVLLYAIPQWTRSVRSNTTSSVLIRTAKKQGKSCSICCYFGATGKSFLFVTIFQNINDIVPRVLGKKSPRVSLSGFRSLSLTPGTTTPLFAPFHTITLFTSHSNVLIGKIIVKIVRHAVFDLFARMYGINILFGFMFLLWSKMLFLECSYFHSLVVVFSLLLPCKSVDVRVCLTTQMFYVVYLGLLRALIAKFSLRQ